MSDVDFSARRPDGTLVDSFTFERTAEGVVVTAGEEVDAGVRVERALAQTNDPD